ncbi:hypothetical protein G7046_g193 [Stylonectria norvegica]|nr:hypothetical protein G7046_g193 [Stylonectria norvegica]
MANLVAIFDAADPTTPGHYAPSQTALLLLDFHTMFIQKLGVAGAQAAVDIAAQMREWAKVQGIHVIHALIDVGPGVTPVPNTKGAKQSGSVLASLTAGGAEEPAELLRGSTEDEARFTRRPGYISALQSPGLHDHLQSQGIKSLIITGLSTSGCVLRTSLAATDAEYVVTVISDGCGDAKQDVHDILLEKVLPGRGYVTTAAEFQKGYESSRSV